MSTIIYMVVLYFILWGNNLLINWLMNNSIIPLLVWFYRLSIVWKIILILIGGVTVVSLMIAVSTWVGGIVSMILSFIFIYNKPTYIISVIMVCVNIIFSEINIWHLFHFDFWIIVIWLIISLFIIEMNTVFIFRDRKEIDRRAGITEPY